MNDVFDNKEGMLHYGVPGMKWGRRKARTSGGIKRSLTKAARNRAAKKKASREAQDKWMNETFKDVKKANDSVTLLKLSAGVLAAGQVARAIHNYNGKQPYSVSGSAATYLTSLGVVYGALGVGTFRGNVRPSGE